jgi:plasmid stability protein
MSKATLYLDDAIHQAIRIKSAETRQSMSDLVNDALRASLAEDLEDLHEIKNRQQEKTVGFEAFLGQLKEDGVI